MIPEQELAGFVVGTNYRDLPADAVEATKVDIVDTLGSALSGSTASGIRQIMQLMADIESGGKCDVIAHDLKLPPHAAALVNVTMAHATEFDDIHDRAGLHAGVTVIPAVLAAAQYLGNVSGQDVITAIALGIEIECRLGLARDKEWVGWIFTPLFGYFGVAAAIAKLLGLGTEQIADAWGLALAQAAGNKECVTSGALAKRFQAGFAASGGVMAALMAARGISGAKASITGKYGLYNLYLDGKYDRAALLADLGKQFEVVHLSYKPYPCCRYVHNSIDAALDLVRENDLQSHETEAVLVEVSQRVYEDQCVPVETKYRPLNETDSQFSVPFGVAIALTKKRVCIEHFKQEALNDPEVLQTLRKIHCEPSRAVMERANGTYACRLTVTAKGKPYSTVVDFAKGSPENPMSEREMKEKLADCAKHAASNVSAAAIERLINTVRNLENLADAGQLISSTQTGAL